MFSYPEIDPVAFAIGPLPVVGVTLLIRWYALAYVAGIGLGWWLIAREVARRPLAGLGKEALDDIITWAVLGIVLGGRLGYVLFYKPDYYMLHPQEILMVWEGGMSFHGGLLGVISAFWLFCRKYHIRFLGLMDLLAYVTPLGLMFGRLANFINGELYGRVTTSPLGMVFPHGGELARHPSQLYQAGLEGLALFIIMAILIHRTDIRKNVGALSGVFLAGYGCARIIGELFREPDAYLGFLYAGATMGQLLCVPMILAGLWLMVRRA
jgi:phosphatidylglycerol---prolipoprotein diacylglyceryl transferase